VRSVAMVESSAKSGPIDGFTLLELLIVLTILGLIMVTLTGGLTFAGRAWETQARQIDRRGDIGAVQNVLSHLLAEGRDFEGDAVSVRFVGAMPRALARGGLYDIEIRVIAQRLVLLWQPHFGGPISPVGSTETELATGVDMIEVGYCYAQTTGPGLWLQSAKDKTRTPSLVRIALRAANGASWPLLVVAPMIDAKS
jgi:general secretion pathway protein J